MKVQFDKSNYSTRSSCLVHVQWMKAQSHQSRIVNLCFHLINACIALVHSYVCLGCVCVGGWVGGFWGGGGNFRLPIASPVICKSHEL